MTAGSHRKPAINLLRQGKLDEADEHFIAAVEATPMERRFTDRDYMQSQLLRVEIALRRSDVAMLTERWREIVALRVEALGYESARTRYGLQELSALARLAGMDGAPELAGPEGGDGAADAPEFVLRQFDINLNHLLLFVRRHAPPTDQNVRLTGIMIEAELQAAGGETLLAARTYQEALDLGVEQFGEQHASNRVISERLIKLYRAADRMDRAASVARRFGLEP
jgi:hypothetical protein